MSHKTETISEIFEQDHREIDAIFAAVDFASPKESLPRFEEFDRRLEAHIGWEEELLFPAVCRQAPHLEYGPIRVMRMEHEDIRRHKAGALKALRQGNGEVAEKYAQQMKGVLTDHNGKEEQILYPTCDELLEPQEAARIIAEVRRLKQKG